MVNISIICLIYKSKDLAEAVYESLIKYTPQLSNGQAEFFFVANDPTDEVVEYLVDRKIPHYINLNKHLSDEELYSLGYGAPEYMRRVYQGYNFGILKARGQRIVLINSDNFFSKDWLENLLKYSDYKKVVSSSLIEPGHKNFGVFPYAIEKDFGRTLDDFKENKFHDYVEKNSMSGISSGGAYMPCLLYRDIAIMAGLYPEGNIAGKNFNDIKRYGDEYFFDRLKLFGVEHITSKDSLVYHLKEGEKSSNVKPASMYKGQYQKPIKLNSSITVKPTNITPYIYPDKDHQEIIKELSKKVTVLILNPRTIDSLDGHILTAKRFDFKNIEIVIITDKEKIYKKYNNEYKVIKTSEDSFMKKTDRALYELFHRMYGEFLISLSDNCEYSNDNLDSLDDNKIYYIGNETIYEETISDYIGNFIIPKKLLVSEIPKFLEYFINDEIVNFKTIDNYKFVMRERNSFNKNQKNNYPTKMILIRSVKKLLEVGPVSFTKIIIKRFLRK